MPEQAAAATRAVTLAATCWHHWQTDSRILALNHHYDSLGASLNGCDTIVTRSSGASADTIAAAQCPSGHCQLETGNHDAATQLGALAGDSEKDGDSARKRTDLTGATT